MKKIVLTLILVLVCFSAESRASAPTTFTITLQSAGVPGQLKLMNGTKQIGYFGASPAGTGLILQNGYLLPYSLSGVKTFTALGVLPTSGLYRLSTVNDCSGDLVGWIPSSGFIAIGLGTVYSSNNKLYKNDTVSVNLSDSWNSNPSTIGNYYYSDGTTCSSANNLPRTQSMMPLSYPYYPATVCTDCGFTAADLAAGNLTVQ